MPQSNLLTKIAIVGASGRVGSHFATSLLATGKHTVTAITRASNSSASKDSLPSGVKIATVDYDNEPSIIAALRGQQFLVITLSVMAPADVHTKLVNAAVKAGVRYVMPNSYGVDFMNEALRDMATGDLSSKGAWDKYMEVLNAGAGDGAGMGSVPMICGFWYEWSLGE